MIMNNVYSWKRFLIKQIWHGDEILQYWVDEFHSFEEADDNYEYCDIITIVKPASFYGTLYII